ncbi:DinB family protein [Streptomyces sp. NPDC020141]|uniref:DinB family protein n=1 Tax=Streptomyces sp. NPDC020141 TaxID=3365065 RepID=UPI00379B2551
MGTTATTRWADALLTLPPCNRCNALWRAFRRETAAELLREYAAQWQRALSDPGTPDRGVGALSWSPLEHGRHIRDMCLVFQQGLDATLGAGALPPGRPDGGPGLPDGGQGPPGAAREEGVRQSVGEEGMRQSVGEGPAPRVTGEGCARQSVGEEDARRVAAELGRAAGSLADRLDTLTADDWARADHRFADDRLSVGFFTRHLLHDIAHDLREVLRDDRPVVAHPARARRGALGRKRGFHG